MKLGDFTQLATNYKHRPSYSLPVLQLLAQHVGAYREGFTVADVGAGTGKLTECLAALGLRGYAVEPNDEMRAEGERAVPPQKHFQWSKGSGELTGLPDSSVDWLFMASSFHWTDPSASLPEFSRALRPGGFLTVIYNPRDVQTAGLQKEIDDKIRALVPELKRKSSGASFYTQDLEMTLLSGGYFHNPVFVEAPFSVAMDHERYLGVWKSVNDIQSQAGPERFAQILEFIREKIAPLRQIDCPYRIRSWTVQATPKANA